MRNKKKLTKYNIFQIFLAVVCVSCAIGVFYINHLVTVTPNDDVGALSNMTHSFQAMILILVIIAVLLFFLISGIVHLIQNVKGKQGKNMGQ